MRILYVLMTITGHNNRGLRQFLSVTQGSIFIVPLLLLLITLPASATSGQNPGNEQSNTLEQYRQLYLSARTTLMRGQMPQYQSQRDRLTDYPLTPYLDYYQLNQRLSRLPVAAVEKFLLENQNSYLADKLRRKWLFTLARQERWEDYRHFYQHQINSTALACLSLQARLATGDSSALSQVTELWQVGHSQPKECDPLFDAWIGAGHLTSEIAWNRFKQAMAAGNRTLANYLTRYLNGREATLADLYIEVGRYPHRIRRHERFQEQSDDMQKIILYGIRRYARQDPVAALRVWERYDAQQLFNQSDRSETQQQLAVSLLRKKQYSEVDNLIADIAEIKNEKLTEVLIRDALTQQNWRNVYQYIQKLPVDSQNSERWLYWRARAMESANIQDPDYQSAREIYSKLSPKRDYYAFLAADILNRDYHLGHSPAPVRDDRVEAISKHPAALRARELRAIGDITNANREWYHMSQGFNDVDDHIAAASVASQWGWHPKTIHSLATAKSWDDLQLRFPLAYNEQVNAAAQKHNISPLLLFAIARQESAFAVNARSPAGALGLMQLMPGTAKQTARKAGIDYQKSRELLVAEKNISLGSFYITELLNKYEGNRILAAAAYNAGPNRVDRWLKNSAQQLPIDVWIETIPYRETRRYVQNILAYSVIYAYRTGAVTTLLTSTEAQGSL